MDQQIDAGQRGRTGARRDQLYILELLADNAQPVEHGGGDDDRGAVLVVMEHRNLHALAQPALDLETFRGLDVLQINAAEGRLQAGDDIDQLVHVELVDLDIEHIDAGELLEQHALAFHHRLGGQRPDGAQPQHRRAVGDHTDQVAARGEVIGFLRIIDDGIARHRHAGRIGQPQIAGGRQRLGRGDLYLPRHRIAVIVERGFAEIVGHIHPRCLVRLDHTQEKGPR